MTKSQHLQTQPFSERCKTNGGKCQATPCQINFRGRTHTALNGTPPLSHCNYVSLMYDSNNHDQWMWKEKGIQNYLKDFCMHSPIPRKQVTRFFLTLPHASFHMVPEPEGWEPLHADISLRRQTLTPGNDRQRKLWIDVWRVHSQQRSSIGATTHPFIQNALVPTRAWVLEFCGRNKWGSARAGTQGLPKMEARSDPSALLPHVLSVRLDARLQQRCKDAEGGLGKSTKKFRRKYHSP